MLKQAAEKFIRVLAEKPALLPLYETATIKVCIQGDSERIDLLFDNGSCSLIGNSPDADVVIKGDDPAIDSLLDGADRLFALETSGALTVSGDQHDLLTLESLFILTGEAAYFRRRESE
ncbi:SCP2 sterol-binding domain-containing protein [Terrilactibacillus sp. S3-3]|nr:SCP2 sterol-binding domain-containing protein [Terrilactibacillus sp. S3-3]